MFIVLLILVALIGYIEVSLVNRNTESKKSCRVGVTFKCKCGKVEGWIYEGATTPPCPFCKRKYKGVYCARGLTIKSIEVKGN